MKKKVYELKIDLEDELSGIDSVSLVTDPAILVNWLAFKKEKEIKVIPDGHDHILLDKLFTKGQPEEELLKDGWVVESITEYSQEDFGLAPTKPNKDSVEDSDLYRVRYKYDLSPNISQNPIILSTREYCRTLLTRNFVWTREELQSLSPNSDPEDGGFGGDPMTWRGGYNCRHKWFKILYKNEGKITNKASANNNKIVDDAGRAIETEPNWNQPSTVTGPTAANPSPSTVKNLGLSKFATDEEKRIVVGPAMLPDIKIPRRDKNGEMYEVYFSADTIKQIAEKYFKNKYIDNNDTDHNGKPIHSNYVVESWIIEDPIHDKAFKFDEFKNLPVGTWMLSMKINDDSTWKRVKDGELKGFSVSGWFSEELAQLHKEVEFLSELAKLIKNYK